MKNKGITDIFFDLDHTLWDFDRNSALAFQQVFKDHKLELEIDSFRKIYEDVNRNYWKLYQEDKVTKEELRIGRLRDTFQNLRISVEEKFLELMAVSYIERLPDHNFLFEGTMEALEYLHSKYKLHIITNGFEEVQYKKLKNSKIEGYFKTVTNSEMVGVKKPNPVIFEFAMKNAGAVPEKSVMIGDNLEADILGAKAVGMHTVFFNFEKKNVKDEISVMHLSELQQIF